MKKFYLVILLFIFSCSTKNGGKIEATKWAINFEKLSYQEVLAKAQAEKKLVLVDFYSVT